MTAWMTAWTVFWVLRDSQVSNSTTDYFIKIITLITFVFCFLRRSSKQFPIENHSTSFGDFGRSRRVSVFEPLGEQPKLVQTTEDCLAGKLVPWPKSVQVIHRRVPRRKTQRPEAEYVDENPRFGIRPAQLDFGLCSALVV